MSPHRHLTVETRGADVSPERVLTALVAAREQEDWVYHPQNDSGDWWVDEMAPDIDLSEEVGWAFSWAGNLHFQLPLDWGGPHGPMPEAGLRQFPEALDLVTRTYQGVDRAVFCSVQEQVDAGIVAVYTTPVERLVRSEHFEWGPWRQDRWHEERADPRRFPNHDRGRLAIPHHRATEYVQGKYGIHTFTGTPPSRLVGRGDIVRHGTVDLDYQRMIPNVDYLARPKSCRASWVLDVSVTAESTTRQGLESLHIVGVVLDAFDGYVRPQAASMVEVEVLDDQPISEVDFGWDDEFPYERRVITEPEQIDYEGVAERLQWCAEGEGALKLFKLRDTAFRFRLPGYDGPIGERYPERYRAVDHSRSEYGPETWDPVILEIKFDVLSDPPEYEIWFTSRTDVFFEDPLTDPEEDARRWRDTNVARQHLRAQSGRVNRSRLVEALEEIVTRLDVSDVSYLRSAGGWTSVDTPRTAALSEESLLEAGQND